MGLKGGIKRGTLIWPIPKYSEAHIYPTRRIPLGGTTKGSRQSGEKYLNATHYPEVSNSGKVKPTSEKKELVIPELYLCQIDRGLQGSPEAAWPNSLKPEGALKDHELQIFRKLSPLTEHTSRVKPTVKVISS